LSRKRTPYGATMRLKRLETYGFKSFADRMTFDFEDGITAIIGPNGCGKSNVVDAIKWVIGEQSAKALRGSEMTDVIFNGCASRRPMAFSEVTLVLDQIGESFGLASEEAAITRRLMRDGTSGYYLNGKPCRLKDIKELFMDTGMGTSAYAVIEQGRIGFIVDANTKDRRAILEEAAGISRYKARRKVALRKLERVELDLQRIGEVLTEVRRRVRTVSKQAEAALLYRELSTRLRDLRMAFALEEFGRLHGDITGASTRLEALVNTGAELSATVAKLEAALADHDVRIVELEALGRELETQRGDVQSRRDVADARSKDAKYRLVEIDQHEKDDRQALTTIGAKLEALRGEHDRTEGLIASAEGTSNEDVEESPLSASYRTKRAELDAVLLEADQLIDQVEQLKSKQVECLRDLSRIGAERNRLEHSRQATEERRKRLEDRSGGQTGAVDGARIAEQAAQAKLDGLMHAAVDNHTLLDTQIRAREEALNDANRLDSELNEIRHQDARADTSLRLLQEQERRSEGVFRGVKDIVAAKERFPGVIGMVADLCRVKDPYVVAIEVALGGQAQHLVTETQAAAKHAIDFLKREKRGRATFLPLDDVRGDERVDQRLLREPGVIGVASRLIDYDDRYRDIFEFLLGNVVIVETLDDAIALRRAHRPRCRLITVEGDVINPGGAMTGGRSHGAEGGGVVSRKNEIKALIEQVADLAQRKQTAGVARDAAKKMAFETALTVEETRKKIQQIDRAVGEAKGEWSKCERDRSHLEESVSSFGIELEEIGGEIAKIEAEAKELHGQEEWFTAVHTKLTSEIEQVSSRLHATGERRNRIQDDVNNLRVDLATSQERQDALRNQLGHLVRQIQEQEDALEERQRRLSSLDTKRTELQQALTENSQAYAEACELFIQLAEKLRATLGERDQLRDATEGNRQALRKAQSRLRECDADKAQVELKQGEARVRLEGLTTRIAEEYQLDLAEAHTNYVRPEDLDWPALRRELSETEKELTAIGPVNLAAIDELEEVQAREQFLDRQFNDLTNAAAKLREIIDHINGISRKMFEDTYKQVRANFQDLFRKLFGGGKADLVLETIEKQADGTTIKVDLLEAGIEIVASPPGKQPKVISQLSGGEKALTAIALLFAVYRTKPSPFCILDEVDAPLDDSNTDIYCHMVREFVHDSQFIVITHNKNTMKHADAIYGITQNEPGVSTKVSVKFEEVEAGHLDLTPVGSGGKGPFAG